VSPGAGTLTYRALIPVKALHEAKSRLAAYLTRAQRERLVLDMLHHVIDVLQESHSLEKVAVVSPDPYILAYAQAWGAQAVIEEQHGHNPALSAAAQQEIATGATARLTISADLPLLRASDVENMIEQSHRYTIVLAPSQDGTGTNALLARPPLAVPYVFGPHSLQRYINEAKQRDIASFLYTSIGTALDIDTVHDLELSRQEQQNR
jgi:2-phospho-L-lactate guanylyltransferase